MDIRFDLNEAQSNILEKYPEWRDLMAAVEFKNTPAADPAGYSGRTVYYNSRNLRQFPRDASNASSAEATQHTPGTSAKTNPSYAIGTILNNYEKS